MANGLPLTDPMGEVTGPLPISTGRAEESVPPSASPKGLPVEQGFFERLKSGDKETWRGVAATLYALADIGEAAVPPGQRRTKGRAQEYLESVAAQDELAARKADRASAEQTRQAEFALKVAQFNREQRKDRFDAFGAILTDLSKALDAGIDPAAAMATSAQRAQDSGLEFMVPMLSGASGDRNFLQRLGPMYELVKDEPAAQVFLARSVMLAKPGSAEAGKFMREFQDYAGSVAVRTILDRLRTNREAYKGKDFDDVASTIAPDNPFVRDVLIGAVPVPDPLRKAVENGLRAVGVKTPELAGKRAEEGPPLSQDVKDVLQSKFGVDPRDLDPGRKADAALIDAARKTLADEATDAEKAKFSPDMAQLRANYERTVEDAKAQVAEKYKGRGPLTPSEVGALRDDYTKASANFIASRDAYARLEDALKDPARRTTSAADVTRLYAFIKMQDPNAVREGELALVQGTSGVVDQAANLYNKLIQGRATLSAQQRENLDREIKGMFRTILKTQLDLETDYRTMAEKRKADPDEAVPGSVIGRFRDVLKDGGEAKAADAIEYVRDPKTKKLVPKK